MPPILGDAMGQSVLIFESDPTFANQLRTELQKFGCQVHVVDDGNVGLQQALSARPDLILLSIELRRMNGFSVCNKLKKDPALKDVPLIIMSSESSDETFEQHRKLRTRAEDYVHKPIAFADLLMHIEPFVPLAESAPAADPSDPSVEPETLYTQADIDFEIDDEILIEEVPSEPPARQSDAAPASPHANDHGPATLDVTSSSLSPPSVPRISEIPPATRISGIPPAARISEIPPATRMSEIPPFDHGRVEVLLRDVEAATARIHELEEALESARLEANQSRLAADEAEARAAAAAAASAKSAASRPGREILDLREALNRKDKELLSLKEALGKKDKEIVEARERSLGLERQQADFDDKILEQERMLADYADKVASLQADKEQARKAGDDFKRRAERAQQEALARTSEISELKEVHARELEAREADLRTKADLALAAAKEAHESAIAQAAADKQSVLEATRKTAEEERARALVEQRRELVAAHEAETSAAAKAHHDEIAKIFVEHDNALTALTTSHDEALAALVTRHEEELAAQKSALEAEREENVAAANAHAAAAVARAREDADRRVALAEKIAAEKVSALTEEAAEKLFAVEREAAEKLAASEKRVAELLSLQQEAKEKLEVVEREAADKLAAAERHAADRFAALQKEAADRFAALQKEAADKLAAADKASADALAEAAGRLAVAERDAADKLAAADKASADALAAAVAEAAGRLAVVERDAANRLAQSEIERAASKAASDARIKELQDELESVRRTSDERAEEIMQTMALRDSVERDMMQARERALALEADLAAAKLSHEETKAHLARETGRLDKVFAKIEADKSSLERAKDALAVALVQIEEAEGRAAS